MCALMLSVQESDYIDLVKLVRCVRTDETVRIMVEQIKAEKMNFQKYGKSSKDIEISVHANI